MKLSSGRTNIDALTRLPFGEPPSPARAGEGMGWDLVGVTEAETLPERDLCYFVRPCAAGGGDFDGVADGFAD
jgi:hypothetical protein